MQRLVLAGGGHAHLHVLKAMAAKPWPDTDVVLISPYTRQIYSGMVPGWMAGHYSLDQCAAGLEPLVSASGARFIRNSVVGLDAERRILHTSHSGDIAYDFLSLDTGALVDSSCLAATSAVLLPIRPLENFILGWARTLEQFEQTGQAKLVVVGGGAAGVELALAAHYRLSKTLGPARAEVSLVAGGGLMPGHGPLVVDHVRRTLERSGVRLFMGYAAGTDSGLALKDGTQIDADCIISATGVMPAPWLAGCGLALAPDGFVAVADGQRSASHAEVFASGDVASRVDFPHPKSGVYAVRAGAVLATNLARALLGQAPLSYQPQKRSLYLLATGPQHAIMSWGGFCAGGHWAWRWKDWIDRRFMKQYDLASTNRFQSAP